MRVCGSIGKCNTCWRSGWARPRRLRARVRSGHVCLPHRTHGGRAAVRREWLRDALPVEWVLAVARGACGHTCGQTRHASRWRGSGLVCAAGAASLIRPLAADLSGMPLQRGNDRLLKMLATPDDR